ncbi:bleomycin resistance protein [Shimia sp. MMG029]|uniref:bleomycin resistance protein n=1 Tax=Shimia sp. MMG029 TaxID=3021978 RepID=UPI0022FE75CB|nr:VOC family protein [Shimia sp. MMG029]MDA5556327.1 VOC family protein [Shimia sp. MMG029]
MDEFLLKQITPFVPCRDLASQIGFYRDVLGFELGFQADNYAFMKAGEVAIRLIEVDAGVNLSGYETSFYVDVSGIDGLYAHLRPQLDRLPAARVRAPFDQDYGQREFHVKDEDCTLVFFGETIAG